jgi:hypothetical protein
MITIPLLIGLVILVHDHERPDLDTWFRQQFVEGRGPCCDGTEVKHIADVDYDTTCGSDGKCHYRVRLYNKWWDVPDAAIVKGPNLSGTTLVWAFPTRGLDNGVSSVFIRCFMPGAGL